MAKTKKTKKQQLKDVLDIIKMVNPTATDMRYLHDELWKLQITPK